MVLRPSGTLSGHLCTTIHMKNLWKAVVHLQVYMSQQENRVPLTVSLEGRVVVQTIGKNI